ncbi:sigma-B regulation protein RsbU (phosphoserine phosphatase) [Vannielia litorea]|uniref:Sigma-B regulation protein RsbU (Phosphoserine phosphatase) n=1 Tax=Vannielia litorea TaxID=1217970 RepID=A0A1N6HJ00_9RHOB|nr:SpoIIE family protein phosphatase [Vannielia litorea]SIO19713.1 sigma-B regulation protein RsbU (phosphoserine phosphatase) [Vannielia litorea]
MHSGTVQPAPPAHLAFASQRRVLVVDDSRMQRRILSTLLTRWGYAVQEAEGAREALDICVTDPPDVVLSDWMMPGMNGIEFCQLFRAIPRESYGYFILLTSKTSTKEIAAGLDAGADDYLAKPISPDELRARLAAGERILGIHAELVEKNRLVTETLGQISALYDSLDRDLQGARKLQQSLIKERHRSFGASQVSLLLRPSGHVGGDLVGFFSINADRVGLFAIDVSGHGVSSALMTARLAGFLSPTSPDQNLAMTEDDFGLYDAIPPAELAATLNRVAFTELDTEHYFTLAYADLDLTTGAFALVQAGHPHPMVLRASGAIEQIGEGGMPIGLVEEARFEQVTGQLRPGDRLFIMSDGLTEAMDSTGDMLGEDGLAALLRRNAEARGPGLLEALTWDLAEFTGASDFADDVSAVLFEFDGPKAMS